MSDLRRANYLDQFDEDTLPSIEQCVVLDGERLHFTRVGLARFRERFARAGINIRSIRSGRQLVEALEASFPIEWERAVASIASKKPKSYREGVERAYLVAIALGDEAGGARLRAVLDRLTAHPLSLVGTTEFRAETGTNAARPTGVGTERSRGLSRCSCRHVDHLCTDDWMLE